MDLFRARVSQTICLGWLQTSILLISASWVGRIIDVSHQNPGKLISWEKAQLQNFFLHPNLSVTEKFSECIRKQLWPMLSCIFFLQNNILLLFSMIHKITTMSMSEDLVLCMSYCWVTCSWYSFVNPSAIICLSSAHIEHSGITWHTKMLYIYIWLFMWLILISIMIVYHWIFLCGVWTQGLTLVSRCSYHLSHSTSLFLCWVFLR
jgi:hypothetical protein